jgi:hypothetical protein
MSRMGSRKIIFIGAVAFSVALTIFHQVPLFTRLLSAEGVANSRRSYNNTAITASAVERDDNPVKNLWKKYKEQHSHQVLLQEYDEMQQTLAKSNATTFSHWSLNGRKFAVGYYSCPLQAGNRLHHFFNSLIWSIVTNRTLLYQYFDYHTCLRITRSYQICNAANTRKDCDVVLKRKSWIPSFGDWRTKLDFKNMTSFSFGSTNEIRPNNRHWREGIENDAGIVDVRNDLVVEFAPMLGQDAGILKSERKRKYLLSTAEAQERAKQLLELGPDYLYGLLFDESFAFQPSVGDGNAISTNTTEATHRPSPTTSTSEGDLPILIVLHSRHSKTNDDGSKIERETKCLDRLLASMHPLNSSNHYLCTILLLSDRPTTLALLQDYISQKHPRCAAKVANHDHGTSFRPEHGPYSGIGFYQDLAMVKHGIQSLPIETSPQVGFVGSESRSSSQLVREIMVYHHRTRQPDMFQFNSSNEMGVSTCHL